MNEIYGTAYPNSGQWLKRFYVQIFHFLLGLENNAMPDEKREIREAIWVWVWVDDGRCSIACEFLIGCVGCVMFEV